MYEIRIKPVLNGFIVNVGCQTVVFNTAERLCEELIRYAKNPFEVEREYMEKAISQSPQLAVNGAASTAQIEPIRPMGLRPTPGN